MGAGLLVRIATAFRAVIVTPMPTGRWIPLLSDIPHRYRGDGRPQRVVRRKHSVIPVPVFSRLRGEIGEPVQKLKRRELDDAAGRRLRGSWRAVRVRGGAGTGTQQMLERLEIAQHVAVEGRDPDAGVDRKSAVLPGEHVGGGMCIEGPLPPEPTDHAAADRLGERGQVCGSERPGREERRRPAGAVRSR